MSDIIFTKTLVVFFGIAYGLKNVGQTMCGIAMWSKYKRGNFIVLDKSVNFVVTTFVHMEQSFQTAISAAYSVMVCLAPGLLLALGLCFFFIKIPQCSSLVGYRSSRKLMAITFVLYGMAILLDEASGMGVSESFDAERLIIITVSAFQAFLFTSTLVTLVDMSYFTVRRMIVESIAMLAFFAVAFGIACEFNSFSAVYYVCVGGYVALLVRYVVLFRRHYAKYVNLMDNYYSSDEDRRLLWVKRSFYWSLGIGLLAFVYSFVPTKFTSLLFMVAAIAYYVFFGIRFINYIFDFNYYQQVIVDATPEIAVEAEHMAQTPTVDELQTMQYIENMMHDEQIYKSTTLTVNVIAAKLGKNHRVVSTAISHCRNTNFKSYINSMRVEEAVRLISSGWLDTHTIDALASECGFTNRVSFYRVFKQQKGVAPTDYLVTQSA